MSACADCVRRGWLLGRLSGHFDVVRFDRRHIREVLALSDGDLIAALAGAARTQVTREHRGLDIAGQRLRAARAGIGMVCRHGDRYPATLLDLADAPAVLYVAGDPDALAEYAGGPQAASVALVGARRATIDGMDTARRMGRGLSMAGVAVVSGMAMGIDAAAHRGALEGGGRTVAVLGCGPDVSYPRTERALHGALCDEAVVVSELPPGTPPRRWAFPARNRVIAALARLTVVVEAAERSGSLITADVAHTLGRDVGAVPGRPTLAATRGSNGLLREGSAVIRDAHDALDELFGAGRRSQASLLPDTGMLSPPLRELLDGVRAGRETVDALCRTPDDVPGVMAALAELEFLGHVRRTGEGRYVTAA